MASNLNWTSASHEGDDGISTVRLRQLDASFNFRALPERLNLLWNGADTDAGRDAMARFEQRVLARLANDEDTALVLVFVEPDHGEFVFHSRSTTAFLAMLESLEQESAPYPIEIDHESDPDGQFYRDYAAELRG
ncbi:DUF695 domain-containing protein [Montanilutibacter psychrotolerans]|nr:DUF695 domain-containing protein [Lysobacter psychrotolerans]